MSFLLILPLLPVLVVVKKRFFCFRDKIELHDAERAREPFYVFAKLLVKIQERVRERHHFFIVVVGRRRHAEGQNYAKKWVYILLSSATLISSIL